MFNATTKGISVTVMPVYIDERSEPAESRYFWAYRVMIENNSGEEAQLVSRYWRITDSNGHVEEVEGEGVVGEQPRIAAGDSYSYTSGCPLRTPSGIMSGRYTMRNRSRGYFEVEIPAFPLDLPDNDPVLN
ncbi:MAG: Co2+/Mg2+ efflux protein ApaG [Rhizobiaceae bacterium]|jgi:ApaG protein|nr:Co2+/Mg2+ efflux protein ApaG [Rhizobiaceae bacterium]